MYVFFSPKYFKLWSVSNMDKKYKKIVASLCCAVAPATFNNDLIKNCRVKAMNGGLSRGELDYLKNRVGEGILLETIIELENCRLKYAKDKNSIKDFKFTHLEGDTKEILQEYCILKVGRGNGNVVDGAVEATEALFEHMRYLRQLKTSYKYLVAAIATLVPGIITAIAGIKGAGILMETLRERRMDKIREERRRKAQEAYDKINKTLYSNSSIDYSQDWKTVEKKFDLLKKKSPHNAEPIDSMVKELRGYFSSCKKNPKAKCKLISIYGPPGCGKSLLCEDMAKALGASNPVKITYADFDPGNKKLSVRQQVSGKWHVGDQERGYLAYGKLVSAILHNKHLFLVLDEIDKLPKEVIPLVISLLWDAADSGRINIDGKDVILEGAVIILPTNQPIYNIKLNDDSGGENMLIKALISRMRIYEFNKPREQDYKVAIKNLLEAITKDVKEDYELELKCDDNIIDWLSKKCVENDIGMRSIRVYDSLIRGAIQEKYDKECEATGSTSITNIKLALDNEENLVCVS